MAVPALIFVLSTCGDRRRRLRGWAIPTATDIAFAARRAGRDRHAPARGAADVPADPGRGRRPVRHHDHRGLLHRRLAPGAAAAGAGADRRCSPGWCSAVRSWWLLLPLAAGAWALVHASGVHATVAGVLLGFDRAGAPRRPPAARSRPGTGRALRAPVAADLGGRSPCRCSRSSPPASRSAASTVWATRWPTRSRSASSPDWCWAR